MLNVRSILAASSKVKRANNAPYFQNLTATDLTIMTTKKSTEVKSRLHARNKNRERYDLAALIAAVPELGEYVKPNKHGDESVDFSSPKAVKLLNKALLHHYYGIEHWDFPDENLCPPIPGRADYLHHMADLLRESNFGQQLMGDKVICVDIGVGASCIYPIIGRVEYGWSFIGTDIDSASIDSAQKIVSANPALDGKVHCRLQKDPKDILYGVIGREEQVDFIICNPPFHASMEEAEEGTRRKVRNLSGKKVKTPTQNFAGRATELVYDGGESKFIQNMIRESEKYGKSTSWFSILVSKQSNLKSTYKALDKHRAKQVRTIPMGTGNKSTRIVAWTFLSKAEQKDWAQTRWSIPKAQGKPAEPDSN